MKKYLTLILLALATSSFAQSVPFSSLNSTYFNKTNSSNVTVKKADAATIATNDPSGNPLASVVIVDSEIIRLTITNYFTYISNSVAWTTNTSLYTPAATRYSFSTNYNDTNLLWPTLVWGTASVTNGAAGGVYTNAGGANHWTNYSTTRIANDTDYASLTISNAASVALYTVNGLPTTPWSVEDGLSPAGSFVYGTNSGVITTTTNLFLVQTNKTLAGWFVGNGSGLTNVSDRVLSNLFVSMGLFGSNPSIESYYYGNSGNSSSTGSRNTIVGFQSLNNNTTGSDNYALGYQVLWSNTTGFENLGLGFQVLFNNISGFNNIGLNDSALWNNIDGNDNFAAGHQSLFNNRGGKHNIAIGAFSMNANTNGNESIAIGRQAAINVLSGGTNIHIGNVGAAGDTNVTRIGQNQTFAYIAGIAVATNGFASYSSNKLASVSIAVGASPFNWTNTFQRNIYVFVDGVSVTGTTAINGGVVFNTIGQNTLPLEPNEWVTITYTIGTPTATWRPR